MTVLIGALPAGSAPVALFQAGRPATPVADNSFAADGSAFCFDLAAVIDSGLSFSAAPAEVPVPDQATAQTGDVPPPEANTDSVPSDDAVSVPMPWLSVLSSGLKAVPDEDAPVESGPRPDTLPANVTSVEMAGVAVPVMANMAMARLPQGDASESRAVTGSVPVDAAIDAGTAPTLPATRSSIPTTAAVVQKTTTLVDQPSGSDSTAMSQFSASSHARSSEQVMKLPAGDSTQWREPLRQALGERLQFQSGATADNAVIRLDPPQLGRVEIAIRHEAGALTVNLSATHSEVLKQLQGIGEHLRQDLVQRHQGGDVSVNVAETASSARSGSGEPGANPHSRGGQGKSGDAEPGRALDDADSRTGKPAFRMNSDEEQTA